MNLALDFEDRSTAERALISSAIPGLMTYFEQAMLQEGAPVRAIHHQPAKPARFTPFPGKLDRRLCAALHSRGIENLYSHQAEAVEHALEGRNVAIVTPTASGKTLCYNLPVLNSLLADTSGRALYLFPTKALAEDQRLELERLNQAIGSPISCHTYDGDTPSGCPPGHPRQSKHRAYESGYAPQRHPPAPHEMGEAI